MPISRRRPGWLREECKAGLPRDAPPPRSGRARPARRPAPAALAGGPGAPPVLAPGHQCAQRAHRAVRARVADAARGAHGERAGVAVVAVAVHELGGREHRLAMALAGVARGLGVAAVLALVVLGDALEAVLGPER